MEDENERIVKRREKNAMERADDFMNELRDRSDGFWDNVRGAEREEEDEEEESEEDKSEEEESEEAEEDED